MKELTQLRPIQAMTAALLFKHRKLMVTLPRQYGGKTEVGVRLAHNLTSIPSQSSCLFIAKNSASRREAAREKFLRLFDPKLFHINTEMIHLKRCPTSQILMRSVDKDPGARRGGTHNFIHWAEVAFAKIDHGETVPSVWGKVFRPMLSQRDGYAYLETTLNGNNSFKEMWDNAKDFGFHRLRVPFSRMLEMGLVTEAEYEKERKESHPLVFAQEYECEWVTFQGRAYNEFEDNEKFVRPVEKPLKWQKVIAGIDWGYSPSATCILFGYVLDDVLYIFGEIYAYRQLIEQSFASINDRLLHWEIDNFACVADHEEDRNDELIRRGIPVTKADKVNVLGNRLQIKEMLWKNQIVIDPSCVNLRRDLLHAVWHDRREGDLDYSQCTEGHYDAEAALRYLVRAFSTVEGEAPETNPHIGQDQASARAWGMNRMWKDDE